MASDEFSEAAPARWLLEAGAQGVPLTENHALGRAVVREAVERWPDWWSYPLGPPYREADVRVLELLREGLRRLGLVRRRGRQLFSTKRGRQLALEPRELGQVLAEDLGGGDDFGGMVAFAVTRSLLAKERESVYLFDAAASLAAIEGWADSNGDRISADSIAWDVMEVIFRGEAYGLIEQRHSPGPPDWRAVYGLTKAGREIVAAQDFPEPPV